MTLPTEPPPPITVVAPVKSAWGSKINWVQAVAVIASLLTFMSGGEINLSLQDQAGVATGITVLQAVVTWVLRTWFNESIPPGAVSRATRAVLAMLHRRT